MPSVPRKAWGKACRRAVEPCLSLQVQLKPRPARRSRAAVTRLFTLRSWRRIQQHCLWLFARPKACMSTLLLFGFSGSAFTSGYLSVENSSTAHLEGGHGLLQCGSWFCYNQERFFVIPTHYVAQKQCHLNIRQASPNCAKKRGSVAP